MQQQDWRLLRQSFQQSQTPILEPPVRTGYNRTGFSKRGSSWKFCSANLSNRLPLAAS